MSEIKAGDVVRVVTKAIEAMDVGDCAVAVREWTYGNKDGTGRIGWGIKPFDHVATGEDNLWWFPAHMLEKVDG